MALVWHSVETFAEVERVNYQTPNNLGGGKEINEHTSKRHVHVNGGPAKVCIHIKARVNVHALAQGSPNPGSRAKSSLRGNLSSL